VVCIIGEEMKRYSYRQRARQRPKQQLHQQQQQLPGSFKWRIVLFSSEDRKVLFYAWIFTPVDIYQPIVFDRDANRYVFVNTYGWYPILDSYTKIKYNSIFIAADNFDLAAANIPIPQAPVSSNIK
jgi:hypothetical protein